MTVSEDSPGVTSMHMLITSSTLNITNCNNHFDNGPSIAKYKLAESAAADAYPFHYPDRQRKCPFSTQIYQDDVPLNVILEWGKHLFPNSPRLMWVKGPTQYNDSHSKLAMALCDIWKPSGQLHAGFFFKRGSPQCGTAKRFAATLAYQLWLSIPNLGRFMEEAINNNPLVLSGRLRDQLRGLILHPIQALLDSGYNLPPGIIVVDALDECEDVQEQVDILEWITYELLSFRIPLGVLITGGNAQIMDRYTGNAAIAQVVELKKHGPDVSAPIDGGRSKALSETGSNAVAELVLPIIYLLINALLRLAKQITHKKGWQSAYPVPNINSNGSASTMFSESEHPGISMDDKPEHGSSAPSCSTSSSRSLYMYSPWLERIGLDAPFALKASFSLSILPGDFWVKEVISIIIIICPLSWEPENESYKKRRWIY
ncbi:hypothetical protein CVT24_006138 [Panaeolus cyanescens]|uniref:Nephrocystin 3-like N-terminal domain-containing protein n=1 Tax=Panaeolus cyanescens TaxID=181874 RepID=A0A409WHF8_9AGAR|nr:hypothetical protein CVT24_006138 [Panaeolus cyanescens]